MIIAQESVAILARRLAQMKKGLVNGITGLLNLKMLLLPSSSGKNTRLGCLRYDDVEETGRGSGTPPKLSSLTLLKLPETPDGDLEVQEHPRPTRGETFFSKASVVFSLLRRLAAPQMQISGYFFHLSFQLKGRHPGVSLQPR